jgi:hypothetical protein
MGLHSITSSAVASSDCGTVMPSALAVFEVDHRLVLVRVLHTQFARLFAVGDAAAHNAAQENLAPGQRGGGLTWNQRGHEKVGVCTAKN